VKRSPWSLPLGGDATDRFLPWIIGLLVFVAAIALAAVLALGGAVERWRVAQGDIMTVELPASAAAEVAAAVAALGALPGVREVDPLEPAEAEALLAPWLGAAAASDLPVPHLIDVRLAPGAGPSLDQVRAALAAVAPAARVEDAGQWLAPLVRTARAVQTVGYGVLALIGLASIATVVFTSTTGLAVHRDAIQLLHLIGAEDGFIAHQFQRQGLIMGFMGGLVGLVLAAGAFVLVGNVARSLAAPLLPRLELEPVGYVLLAGLPFAAAVLVMIVARLTVLRALARLP
jgi:cell division transport system permease protein